MNSCGCGETFWPPRCIKSKGLRRAAEFKKISTRQFLADRWCVCVCVSFFFPKKKNNNPDPSSMSYLHPYDVGFLLRHNPPSTFAATTTFDTLADMFLLAEADMQAFTQNLIELSYKRSQPAAFWAYQDTSAETNDQPTTNAKGTKGPKKARKRPGKIPPVSRVLQPWTPTFNSRYFKK